MPTMLPMAPLLAGLPWTRVDVPKLVVGALVAWFLMWDVLFFLSEMWPWESSPGRHEGMTTLREATDRRWAQIRAGREAARVTDAPTVPTPEVDPAPPARPSTRGPSTRGPSTRGPATRPPRAG